VEFLGLIGLLGFGFAFAFAFGLAMVLDFERGEEERPKLVMALGRCG